MELSHESKLTQGQQIRVQAFFMANQMSYRGGNMDPPSPDALQETAERLEDWLKKASTADTERLVKAARAVLHEYQKSAITGSSRLDQRMQELAEAVSVF